MVFLLLTVDYSNILISLDPARRQHIVDQLEQVISPVEQSVVMNIIAAEMAADEVVHIIDDKDELVAYSTLLGVDIIEVSIDPN